MLTLAVGPYATYCLRIPSYVEESNEDKNATLLFISLGLKHKINHRLPWIAACKLLIKN